MKKLLAAAFCLFISHISVADELVVNSPLMLTNNVFFNVESCFSGNFVSYDSWQAFLKKNKPGFNDKPEEITAKQKAEFERLKDAITCENFDYKVDDVIVRGFYIAPKRPAADRKLPLVIFNRGGNGDFGASPFGYLLTKLFPLAEQGFVVVGSQYRGYIKRIPNSGYDEFGGKDLNDVLELVNLAKFFPHADANKIGMMGVSRGGMMTYMAARESRKISSIAVISGPSDLLRDLSLRPDMENVYRERILNYKTNKEKVLAERSALLWADKIPKKTPILLVHGTSDERVNIRNALDMDKKLTELKHNHKLVTYEGGDHSLTQFQRQLQAELVEWFKATLH